MVIIMKDIMNMKLKKNIDFKQLPKNSLKFPKLKTSLPINKGMLNMMSFMKGSPLKKDKGFNLALNFDKRPRINQKVDVRSFIHDKNFPVRSAGMTRIKQQKGLNPWGDFDGDGLINMLDCHPRNKNLQGPEHSLEDKLNTLDESEEEVIEQKPMSQPAPEPVDEEISKRQKLLEMLDIKEREKRLSLLRREQQSAEMDLKEKKKQLEALDKKKRESKLSRAAQPLTGAVSTISTTSRSFGGFGVSQQGILGATATNASQYKLLLALGKAPPLEQQPQQQMSQAQQDPSQAVVSPYSKRRVSYVRGPYRKQQ